MQCSLWLRVRMEVVQTATITEDCDALRCCFEKQLVRIGDQPSTSGSRHTAPIDQSPHSKFDEINGTPLIRWS